MGAGDQRHPQAALPPAKALYPFIKQNILLLQKNVGKGFVSSMLLLHYYMTRLTLLTNILVSEVLATES